MPYAVGCLGAIISAIILVIVGVKTESTFLMYLFFFGIFASVFGGLIWGKKRDINIANKVKNSLLDYISRLEINSDQFYVGDDGESAIVIDENDKKVAIIYNQHEHNDLLSTTYSKYEYEHRIFDYKDILKSEILKDGKSVTSTSATSVIGGAILGGMLAGGAGAVIGGLSGEKETTESIEKIELQIVVNDIKNSIYRITFGIFGESMNSIHNYQSIKDVDKIIHHWHSLLSQLIKLADSENENKEPVENRSSLNVADEIRNLAELLKEGYITQEEFEIEKQKLLNR